MPAPSGWVESTDENAPVPANSWRMPPRILSRVVFRFGLVIFLATSVCTFAAWKWAAVPPSEPYSEVEFNTDIRPLLAAKCFACHGPGVSQRKSELRLDTKEGLLGGAGKAGAVIPGKPDESELFRRISADSAGERMPPTGAGTQLSKSQRILVRRWIEQGAKWREHWAFCSIGRPTPPLVQIHPTLKNEIDCFILRSLDERGLKPSPEADPITLLRRLRFDLTGLPPSIEEVDAFVADHSDASYEKTVDRLLASPQFGERMATWWLDLVRYAESVGYNGDQPISVFPFRDYVIQSFNENKPFDQFTLEQLAGDLLPGGTAEQKIASGYNRLGMMTSEADVQRPEYLAKYIAERVRNLGGTWLGVTLGCCECHDHKYDPFRSKDFYSLEAFFADIQERGAYIDAASNGDWGPKLEFPTPAQQAERARLEREIAAARASLAKPVPNRVVQASGEKKGEGHDPSKAIQEILTLAPDMRTDTQRADLDEYVRSCSPSEPARRKLAELQCQLSDLRAHIPSTLVTVSVPPRTIRLLPRGNWQDDTGPVMVPAFPEALPHSRPHEGRLTRVDLARWVASRENPLTARVFANRVWKLFFGAGLARNLDDHGTQGDAPSHSELLDWLAGQFIDSGWNVKHVIKVIVMSGTYRQSSEPNDSLRERDPDNRWLARQGRFRLDAEMVRDNALSIAGLLVDKVGGPSVKPYQPSGFWAYLNFPTREWRTSAGHGRYRRSIYTHWQRQYLHPALLTFDAPTREECIAQRPRSNTPLQSLVLMNDPEFVEAAIVFAEHIIEHRVASTADRLDWAFRRALSRPPRVAEAAVLTALLDSQLAEYRRNLGAADEMLVVAGRAIPSGLEHAELASWASVSRAILNVHETITRY
ncbi:MAG TPA: PSD1 and planctomycete cytochrome C domain-containing protein [Planctomycetaceae bacterium]|nr:PSD1 and planctomycete cytochrome C domain-containing protein [Planctomycetaceae bacterium]